ncbi:hypothetical protein OK351_14940 [Glutamicibacter sp. MNS18]|uniref:hypothetical protein n=1 Tax=Glutamicibacter sp. MNS18 TaxID=2989817 RepID=UPI0022369BBC|nr:hypothetical protein [Glutamicibacter sp. MNS18]MCW4466788.1 hypothetical protein [Glutamicibacter sp. MNS18]
MNPEIIVMLTHHDVTVANARELFRESADLPIKYWGFKDNGLSFPELGNLVTDMREAGKSPVLEVVNFDEAGLLKSIELAVDCGVEYFTGGIFSDKALEQAKGAGMKYYPFCGNVGGSVIELRGSHQSVIDNARRLIELGVDGVDLVAYRYKDGDPVELAKAAIEGVGAENLIIAGSINSCERMQIMAEVGPFGYTMGGALFDGKFVEGGSFHENLERVVELKDSFEVVAR